MSLDFRVDVDWVDHPQTHLMADRLGPSGPHRVIEMWSWAARFRPNGALTARDPLALASARGWGAEWPRVWAALEECGWVERCGDGWQVHGWPEAQPWVAGSFLRSERAKRGWQKRRGALAVPSEVAP